MRTNNLIINIFNTILISYFFLAQAALATIENTRHIEKYITDQNIPNPYNSRPGEGLANRSHILLASNSSDDDYQVFEDKTSENSPEREEDVEYSANKEPLNSLSKNIASLFNITAVISKKVKGNYTGVLRFNSLDDAMDELSRQFDLIWYKTGTLVYLYKSDELKSSTIKTRSLTPDALKKTLEALGSYDKRFPIKGVSYDGVNLINVSAPPIYHEKIQEVVASFSEAQGSTAGESVIKVFKLKYSSAYDRNYEVDGKSKVIPGIATILNNIFSQGFDPNTAYLAGNEGGAVMTNPEEKSSRPTVKLTGSKHSAYPDIKTNSIIVSTYKSAIPMITQLISTLDVEEKQIEIELNIVDVNSNTINTLGVDWSGSYKTGNMSLNFNQSGADTLVNTSKINASITALTTEGKADIVARPSVIVKNNIEAVLENTETFYVRLTGVETVDLVPVDYGTKVVVQPRIMQTPGDDEVVYVTVNVSDGSSSPSTDGSLALPKVRNMYISTQASVKEGESLLLGGYSKDRLERDTQGIPGISKVPILRHFFSSSTDTSSHQVRLFIITPRIQDNMVAKDNNTPELPKDVDEKIERIKHLQNQNENIGKLSDVQVMVGCGTPKELRVMRSDIIRKGGKTFIRQYKDKSCLYIKK